MGNKLFRKEKFVMNAFKRQGFSQDFALVKCVMALACLFMSVKTGLHNGFSVILGGDRYAVYGFFR